MTCLSLVQNLFMIYFLTYWLIVNALFITCSWLVHPPIKIVVWSCDCYLYFLYCSNHLNYLCYLSFNDLKGFVCDIVIKTCIWLVHESFMTYPWPVHDFYYLLFLTYSQLVHVLYILDTCLVHNLLKTCLWLIQDFIRT